MKDYQELVGQRIGFLLVEEVLPRVRGSNGRLMPALARCLCDCGQRKEMKCSSLANRSVRSCGCQRGNLSGKKHASYKKILRCYRCPSPDEICTYSRVLKICCHECPKREQCKMVCDNRPEKCGAKQFLATEDVRDFLTQKGDNIDASEIFG